MTDNLPDRPAQACLECDGTGRVPAGLGVTMRCPACEALAAQPETTDRPAREPGDGPLRTERDIDAEARAFLGQMFGPRTLAVPPTDQPGEGGES